jgi:NitT/TauT family transport system ATP-binding protein
MAVIEVGNIRFFYDVKKETEIIHDVSFSAEKEEFVSIIGPSGCGKSTLLRIIAGLMRADSGIVRYLGREILQPIPELSFVFQDFALLPWMTNIDNVKLALSSSRMDEKKKEQRAFELLGQFGLSGFENSYPNVLSGGMKQRVGIARAIASNPKVLLMDEPFSSLDELTADALRSDILQLLRNKKLSVSTVIMVTHNVEEAVELSDKVVVLSKKPSATKKIEKIPLPYPRDRESRQFLALKDMLLTALNE